MSSKKLKISSAPTKDNSTLAKNLVYLEFEQYKKLGSPDYFKIKKCIFKVDYHDKITEGRIGLNKIQRMASRVSLGDEIMYSPYTPPEKNFDLSSISIEINFINPRMYSEPEEIDAKGLTDRLNGFYGQHIFREDQKFVVNYFGHLFLCQVTGFEVLNTDALKKNKKDVDDFSIISADIGRVMKGTSWIISKKRGAFINFTNLAESRVSTAIFKSGFNFEKLGIGGLDNEFMNIFRRAFASRIYGADIVKKLGVKHVKGILLFGPPGTGKTLIARQIGKMLNCRTPKIVNGPEVLNKYVGQSEENIRKLFDEAEKEYKQKGDSSELHLIIFDEIDAICKQRGSTSGGTGVNDSVVNQLLSKIDGVNSLNNILIIGMTNRLDLIDSALLRPGRFEVRVEIGLPNEKGRLQIFRIHTMKMIKHKILAENVDLKVLAKLTKNFSGAEIEGLVKSATSFAYNREIDIDDLGKTVNTDNVKITMTDFENALKEVIPAFGVSNDEIGPFLGQGLLNYGKDYEKIYGAVQSFAEQVKLSTKNNFLSVLLEGPIGSGKTAIAANLAIKGGYPYVKIVSSENMVGYNERRKSSMISKVFEDAYKSPLSIIVLDNIERLIELVNIGPRFSNMLLQTLLILIKKKPPKGRKLLIIGTTSMGGVLSDMDIVSSFNVVVRIPHLTKSDHIGNILKETQAFEEGSSGFKAALKIVPKSIGIKKLLLAIDMAKSRLKEGKQYLTSDLFSTSLLDCGCFDFIDRDL